MMILRQCSRTVVARRVFSSSLAMRNEAPKSSCAAGTVLNLKVKKNGDEVVALEDDQYPAWLWDCLDDAKIDEQLKQTDYLKWKKKQINKTNTKKIKNNNFLSKM